jgi:hypothetical protein
LVDAQHPIGPRAAGGPQRRRLGWTCGTATSNNAGKPRLKLAYDEVAGRTGNINRFVRAVGEKKDASGWIDEFDVEGYQWVARNGDDAGDREYFVGGCRQGKQPRGKRDPEASDGSLNRNLYRMFMARLFLLPFAKNLFFAAT